MPLIPSGYGPPLIFRNGHLATIKLPTFIINARNDSFLGNQCYPHKEAEKNPALFLELPDYGGHIGFYDRNNIAYTEKRTLNFLEGQH